MNETEVTELFAAAVERPDVDRIDTVAVLRGGRRRRRRQRLASAGGVLGVVAVIGVVEYAAPPPHRSPSQVAAPTPSASSGASSGVSTTPGLPVVLAVACTPSGIRVSAPTVAASAAGVVLRVSSTLPEGAYLTHDLGGEPLPAAPRNWILAEPPGALHLSCTVNGDAGPGGSATVTVTDPGGYWSPVTLAQLGCAAGGWLDSKAGGRGGTREAAVDDVLRQLSTPGRTLTAERARLGYREAPTQTWLASAAGRPYVTLVVREDAAGFTASPEMLCSP